MTQLLLGIDLALSVLGAALWVAAAVLRSRSRKRLLPIGCVAAAIVALLVRIGILFPLATAGWWFVEEKVLLSLPIAVVTTAAAVVLAVPSLLRRSSAEPEERQPEERRPSPGRLEATGLLAAGYGAAVGVVTTFVVGYPVLPAAAVILVAILILAIAITWSMSTKRSPRSTGGIAALTALVLVASGGYGWLATAAGLGQAASSHGHGPVVAAPAAAASVSVADLVGRPADDVVRFELEARRQTVTLPSGTKVKAWTFGSLPGPQLTVHQGDNVEVVLRNRDIEAGVTIHWHGVDVPNGEDGVAGVTQDAVRPGQEFTYRFVAEDTGTYWYHTHQHSAVGVRMGLFGAFVVLPRDAASDTALDLALPVHSIAGAAMLGGSDRVENKVVPAGSTVRLRLINSDSVPRRILLHGTEFEVVAVDGRELNGPTRLEKVAMRIPAGGRYDLRFRMPNQPVGLRVDGMSKVGLDLAPEGSGAGTESPTIAKAGWPELDLLGYGTAAPAAELHQPFDVNETLVLDRNIRFVNGLPGFGYTVNGSVYPLIPATQVSEGDLVKLTVVNRGSDTHPMHPHGHHVLVLSRNGVAPTGSPLWLDTFDVQPGEVWVVALRADNPGIWVDHCHNLDHAVEGMLLHIAYRGVATPFRHGGAADNAAE
jgi:FtsP/CotA-like multicopper oxidase with cupredoxin domain